MNQLKILEIDFLKEQKPEKQNPNNTIESHYIANIHYTDEYGIEREIQKNVIEANQLFEAIRQSSSYINISNCLVVNFLSYKYNESIGHSYDANIVINNFEADNVIFQNDVDFSNVEFTGISSFKNTIFMSSCLCFNTIFTQEANFRDSLFCEGFKGSLDCRKNLNLESTEFRSYINLTKSVIDDNLYAIDSNFQGECYFENMQISTAKFLDCRFKKQVSFRMTSFKNATFTFSKFFDWVSFVAASFQNSAVFQSCEFNKLAEFSGVKFNSTVSFVFSKFLFTASFYKAKINEKIIFNFVLFDSITYLQFSNVSICSLYKAKFSDCADFTDLKFEYLDLRGCIFDKSALFSNTIINRANRETYRTIKHEMLKVNNRVDAVKYFKLEIAETGEEQETSNLEKVLLYLYAYVNDYGTDIGRAIRVFCCFTLILFLLFTFFGYEKCYFPEALTNLETIYQAVKKSLHNYTLLLLPTHKLSDLYGQISVVGIVLDYFFRIYIPIMFFFILQPLKKYKSW